VGTRRMVAMGDFDHILRAVPGSLNPGSAA
jgi:hypothetical protein